MAVGDFRCARMNGFRTNLASQIFGGYRAVSMHQNQQRLGILVFHDQGFHHSKRVPAQLGCTPLRAAVFDIRIEVLAKGKPSLTQPRGGRGFTEMVLFSHEYEHRSDRGIAVLSPDRINRLEQLCTEHGPVGVDVFIELGHRGHADDGAGYTPFLIAIAQGHLRGL